MGSNYQKQYQKDYENVVSEVGDLKRLLKNLTSTIKTLNDTINAMNTTIQNKDEENKKLLLEIERLKNNNAKNSSNSGKPSSKDGFKKIIHNSRSKTTKKQGGQPGHKGSTTDVSKIEQLIETGAVKHSVFNVNKTNENQNKPYVTRYVQDIEITSVVKEYRYYPNDLGKYDIPKEQNNVVTYGNELKAIAMLLVHRVPASMDQSVNFLKAITKDVFDLTKATLVNWSNSLSDKLGPFTGEILQGLYNATYVHTDESPININGKNHQLHNYSNEEYTLQYVHESKTRDAMEQIGFLSNYIGTLIHDHNRVQYNFGTKHAECNAHILRYLKGVEDFTKHIWSIDMAKLLQDILHQKNLLKAELVDCFDIDSMAIYVKTYDEILNQANKQYQSDYDNNAYKDEERRLITRLAEYKDNHLLFMYDFKIPFSNNRAEADIRPAKRKLNIGIFRSEVGAKYYLKIRSFISTFLKNNRNVFEGIKDAFDDKVITLKQV
jgi:regulator of replication initiation timing